MTVPNIFVCGCSGPREDATRIGSAGVVRRQAVDVSPLRRVNQVGGRIYIREGEKGKWGGPMIGAEMI